ncbi:MAG: aldo/keto reductase [Lachnospiraceae bacterium]|nr:aldo/keto reductase [Lachnospiraceae bacterium]
MIYKSFQSIQLSRLGLGNMRLPLQDAANPKSPIDYPAAHEIIDRAYEQGINYFDTAYVYNDGDSEKCLGECMKKHPRDSFYLATKFHIGANPDYKAVFEEQLARLQTDHIDFYLIHCLMDNNIDQYLESSCIDYFLEQKAKGRITYLGFSSHAGVQTLERFADHHAWDFAQLQINYYDWLYGTTKEEYQILADRNIPIMVMEPVRGGRLADLTPEADALLQKAHPDWSIASWALRFVESLPQVQVILSGMSTMEQMEDNLHTFSEDTALENADKELLFEAAELFKSQVQVPCTACRYCCSGCPKGINIPEFLKIYNAWKVDGPWALNDMDKVESEGKPSDCIACGACMGHCPQNIKIPEYMKELGDS